MCAYTCPYTIFKMDTGEVTVDLGGEQVSLPVTCRQSDLKRARELAEELKNRVINGKFEL
jgi:hypothetical protein